MEPAREDSGGHCQAACTIAEFKEGCVYLKVVKVREDEYLIKEDSVVGSGTSTFPVNVANVKSPKNTQFQLAHLTFDPLITKTTYPIAFTRLVLHTKHY